MYLPTKHKVLLKILSEEDRWLPAYQIESIILSRYKEYEHMFSDKDYDRYYGATFQFGAPMRKRLQRLVKEGLVNRQVLHLRREITVTRKCCDDSEYKLIFGWHCPNNHPEPWITTPYLQSRMLYHWRITQKGIDKVAEFTKEASNV